MGRLCRVANYADLVAPSHTTTKPFIYNFQLQEAHYSNEVDTLHRTVMFARPKITDKRQIVAVRLIQYTVIDTQRTTLQIQERRGLIVQILAVIVLPLQKTGGTDIHDFP